MVKLPNLICQKCGYGTGKSWDGKFWVPRTENPKTCPNPKCRTVLWKRYPTSTFKGEIAKKGKKVAITTNNND